MGKKKDIKEAQRAIGIKLLAEIETLLDNNGSAEDIKNLASAYSDVRSYY